MRKSDKYAKLFGVSKLDRLLVATMEEWDDAKHRKLSDEEIGYINSIGIRECPYEGCGSTMVKRDGVSKRSGVQRYRCKSCGRSFTPLTGTLFDSNKIPVSERLEFILHLLEQHSLKTSASDNMNAKSTGGYWIFKVFLALRGCQDPVVLQGEEVWYDEFFIPEARSRKEKKRDGTYKRGLSEDQICVFTATDGVGSVFVAGPRGKADAKGVLAFLKAHVKEGVAVHHDGDKSHRMAIEELKLVSKVHYGVYEEGEEDLMEPINTLHSYLSRFLSQHLNFRRSMSQDWLNLFWVSMNIRPLEIAAKWVIERMVKTKKVVRYRNFYGRKKKKAD